MATVSVVILNFNGKHFLEKFLPGVIQFSPGHEIVVADNHSSDGSITYLKTAFPQVRIIQFQENLGFCQGYNKALQQIESDYFVILNSDIEVTDQWLDPILGLLESDPKIAAVQPKLLDYHRRDKFEYAGGAGGFMDKFGYPFCRGRLFNSIEMDYGQYDDTREVFWATGACLIIRAELFRKYHGFDADFFAHMEEIDLCWRMKQDGYKVMYCGRSVVYHVGGGTLPSSNPRKTYLNFRNSLLVLIKNLPVSELLVKVPFRWLIDWVAISKFLLDGKWRDAWMILKAHWYTATHFVHFIRKRSAGLISFKKHTGVYNGFLLFQYYLMGVRKFTNLRF
ncbi:MAG: glycosyltransferase family 2 protein [Cyclobacteriaceae bacterium]|nr:glycosyltransferase family 2 protein [Cyclobacteriaceae bacterium]